MVKNEIKVFARLRPEENRKRVVSYQIHQRPKGHLTEDFLVLTTTKKLLNEYINNCPASWNFSFHKIFDENAKQDEIFENVAERVVQSVLSGYNGTIFAYGQTGSGKTYSITGDQKRYEDRGILPRTVQYLFEVIQKNPDNMYSVEVAYLEIYNENGYDLLDPKHDVVTKLEDLPRVTIQEDEAGSLHLKNLSFRSVDNERDALDLFFLGDTNRSHCIFTIVVSVKQFGSPNYSRAKMHLVDLAGSERVYKCSISGTILTEAKHINLSLHYLEQVIVCLGQENISHIPYRNSLLTAILRDSLGGNCLTTMLATLSVKTSNLQEAVSTCRFAQRVALIKNDVNLIFEKDPENENMLLKKEIFRLEQRIRELTKKQSTEDLTDQEKQQMNSQVENFLRSDSTIEWGDNPQKIQYCFKLLRDNFTATSGGQTCTGTCSKNLEYYKSLVIQRDKEISLLVNMLKKQKASDAKSVPHDKGVTGKMENNGSDGPAASVDEKKNRLKEIIRKAKPVADDISNSKTTIAEFRMELNKPEVSYVEAQKIYGMLEREQSKLADNLFLLKSLKEEASTLKSDLAKDRLNTCQSNLPAISESLESGVNPATVRNQVPTKPVDNLSPSKSLKEEVSTLKSDPAKDRSNTDQCNLTTFSEILESGANPVAIRNSLPSTLDNSFEHFVIVSGDGKEKRSPRPIRNLKSTSPKRQEKIKSNDTRTLQGSRKHSPLTSGRLSPRSKEIVLIDPKSPRKGMDDCKVTQTRISTVMTRGSPRKCTRTSNERSPGNSPKTRRCPGLNFTQNVAKLIRTKHHQTGKRSPEPTEKTNETQQKSQIDEVTPKCSFRTPSILRNILHLDKGSNDTGKNIESPYHSDSSRPPTTVIQNFRDDLARSRADLIGASNLGSLDGKCDTENRASTSEANHTLPKDTSMEEQSVDILEPQKSDIDDRTKIGDEKTFMKSLPLTGDPEIDEEIIAFYKAKRSGGTY